MREQRGQGLTSELKAAAREALHLGARYAEAGRAWLNQRTTMMNQRSQEPQWREQGRQRQTSAQGRQPQGGDYGSPRETGYGPQGEYGAGYRGSEYGSPEDRNRQQHYRDSGWQPSGRGYRAGQQGREHGQREYGQQGSREDYERGEQYGVGYGAGYSGEYSGDYSRGEYQRNAPRAGMGAQGQTYESGYTDWRRGAGRERGERYYGQGQRGSQLDEQGLGEQGLGLGRYGGRRQMETAGFGFDEDYSRRSGEYGRGYGAGSGYTDIEDYPQRPRHPQGGGLKGSDYGGRQSQRGRGPRQYTRSDERVMEDICERLTDDEYIDASDVTVRVDSGMVTLSGEVGERWMKHRAEDIADACSGVRQVENRLRVQGGNWSAGSYQPRSASSGNGNTVRSESESSTHSSGTQTH